MDKIVAKVGVVLLYGKYGSYKTPLTIHLAHCVATGAPFLGLATQQARVLYIEGDTPMLGIWPRLQTMNPNTANIDFAFIHPGMNVVSPTTGARNSAICSALAAQHAEKHYGLVVIDSLRTSHHMPDKDSEVPSIVYGAFAELFPFASVLIVHHDRKTKVPDGRGGRRFEPDEETDNESFSGSQAWIDRATTSLKLRRGFSSDREWISLAQSKSQVGTQIEPIQIHVTDGCHFSIPRDISDPDLSAALSTIARHTWRNKNDLDRLLATHFSIPAKLARARRIEYESNVSPIR